VWATRRLLREVSSLERIRKCSRVGYQQGGPVLRATRTGANRVVGFAGLVRCGSVLACRGCAQRIVARRAAKMGELFGAVRNAGGGFTFVSSAPPGPTTRAAVDGVQGAYDFPLRSRAWPRNKVTFNVEARSERSR
jgi:hypothetical protein